MENKRVGSSERKEYQSPQLKRWGTVADLTEVGTTNPGGDVKPSDGSAFGGSVYNKNSTPG